MSLAFYLQKIHAGEPLGESEAAAACEILMQQDMGTPAAGAYLMALALRGETVEELVGMAQNLKKRTSTVPTDIPCCDVLSCGTADSSPAVILGAALLMATAGVPIAKLYTPEMRMAATTLGLLPTGGPDAPVGALNTARFALLDPADYTELLRAIRGHQQSMPIPTTFDRLWPLAHPAPLQSVLLAVAPAAAAVPMAQALRRLRVPRALVLATVDALCPFTYGGKATLVELSDGRIAQDEVQPADFDVTIDGESIAAADGEKQNAWLRAFVDGRETPLNTPIVWTAALGIYAAGHAKTIPDAINTMRETMALGTLAGVLARIQSKR